MQPFCLSLCCAVVIGVTHYALRVTFLAFYGLFMAQYRLETTSFNLLLQLKDHTATRCGGTHRKTVLSLRPARATCLSSYPGLHLTLKKLKEGEEETRLTQHSEPVAADEESSNDPGPMKQAAKLPS